MRKLKFHEKKIIRKTNFLEWKREGGHRENLITNRYHMGGRDDYKKYRGLCRMMQKQTNAQAIDCAGSPEVRRALDRSSGVYRARTHSCRTRHNH
ncbi:hypothetical protein Bca4012_086562 [Brassica carinata]|uniref:Small ribosomal subunit protein uS4 N-terminal domain-containing protein n=2 Tax=Brassica TaxID=3705 RepID=A0A0D3A1X0_BRAOL|nr:hypothetical protein F2Q69_00032863 [Brassica cretica]